MKMLKNLNPIKMKNLVMLSILVSIALVSCENQQDEINKDTILSEKTSQLLENQTKFLYKIEELLKGLDSEMKIEFAKSIEFEGNTNAPLGFNYTIAKNNLTTD